MKSQGHCAKHLWVVTVLVHILTYERIGTGDLNRPVRTADVFRVHARDQTMGFGGRGMLLGDQETKKLPRFPGRVGSVGT